MRTAGAVRRLLAVAVDGDGNVALAVEEPVHGLQAMTARDDHGTGPEGVDDLGQLLTARVLPVLDPGERGGLVQVRRHDRREGEEPPDEHVDRVVSEELRPRGSDHDRVDDQGNRSAVEKVRDRLDDRSAEEHPRLRRVDADVLEERLELCADEGGRDLMDGRHLGRRLCREGDERAHPVAAEAGERLQVSLDAGATPGVRGGDCETARYHRC